jgi:hypothetical protein
MACVCDRAAGGAGAGAARAGAVGARANAAKKGATAGAGEGGRVGAGTAAIATPVDAGTLGVCAAVAACKVAGPVLRAKGLL